MTIALWFSNTIYCIISLVDELNLVMKREMDMSDEILDDVMIKGSCKGKADAIVNCQCNIESAPTRCEQAEHNYGMLQREPLQNFARRGRYLVQ